MLYRYTFPIENYYCDGVFEMKVYFEGDHCPTYQEVISHLRKAAKEEEKLAEDPYNGPALFEIKQCLDIAKACRKDFPRVGGNLVGKNTFYDHPKYGKRSVNCDRIDPFRV